MNYKWEWHDGAQKRARRKGLKSRAQLAKEKHMKTQLEEFKDDIERIEYICDLLRRAWKLEPQQRLGQFITNINTIGDGGDLFYAKDRAMIESMKRNAIGEYDRD